ncbi:MAG TPA: ATP-binding protein, partial [Kofleriaceae bacterium]|nr:ATP-binding protein [Kofleriaceae bacterium]
AALGAGCTIRLRSDDGGHLHLAAAHDADPAWLERFHQVIGDRAIRIEESPLVAKVFRSGSQAVVADLDGLAAGALAADTRDGLRELGIKSFALVPLAVHGETIGVLSIVRHGAAAGALDQRELDFAQTIADHAALSISNARLYDAAHRELATRRRVESTFRVSEEARLLAQGVVDTVRDPLLVLDGNLRVKSGNLPYYECFRTEPHEVEDRPLGAVGGGEWNVPALLAQLRQTAEEGTPIDGFEVEREFTGIGRRVMVLSARKILGAGRSGMVLLVISDVTRRVDAERSLRDHARQLEERGRELESANHELDSFSYSVSHDLRAPLRAIDGFARILAEEHGTALDGEGLRLLGIIRNNIRKMAQLIDDLLAFSRLGRKPLAATEIDMDALVRQIAADAIRSERSRAIELRIGALPPALGDRALIEQVWVNLISNAVKYTRARGDAIITIDGVIEIDQVVYRIADNGIGFDMRFANKLFGVFQRLHAPSEFEGTGVGLALVRRIVVRHGGWISADGRPGAGATFEFALPRRH